MRIREVHIFRSFRENILIDLGLHGLENVVHPVALMFVARAIDAMVQGLEQLPNIPTIKRFENRDVNGTSLFFELPSGSPVIVIVTSKPDLRS